MKRRKSWLLGVLVTMSAGLGSGVAAQAPVPPGTDQWTGIRVFESDDNDRTPEQIAADGRLRQRIQARLEADRWVPSYQVGLAVQNGIVALSGTVDNLLTKERAAQVVRTMGGVRDVENQLNVSLPSVPDYLLASQAAALLQHDPVLKSRGLRAEAQDGFITLSGGVDSAYRRELAGMLAKGLPGVRGVENKVRVMQVAHRLDEEIQADVSSRLQWEPGLNNPQVEAEVVNGRVVLRGWVEDARARQRVFKAAWVAGVQGVDVEGVKVVQRLLTNRAGYGS